MDSLSLWGSFWLAICLSQGVVSSCLSCVLLAVTPCELSLLGCAICFMSVQGLAQIGPNPVKSLVANGNINN